MPTGEPAAAASTESGSADPSSSLAAGLRATWEEMRSAPQIVQPSSFWRDLIDRNERQLDDQGFAHFKRTINHNYFSWVPHTLGNDQLRAVAKAWLRDPTPAVASARLGDVTLLEVGPDRVNPFARARSRRIHAIFTALLWEYVRRRDPRGILSRLEEPALGDPVVTTHRGRRITPDLCNSVHEFYSATAALADRRPGPGGVLELGGGYGRLAWVFLHEFPQTRYIMCDIPPALNVAQEYLSTLFADRRRFGFRHFDDPAEVADELAEAQIAFLTPNQLELLDPLGVSLFVNVSSLHEMRPEQVAHYLRQADRHTDGCFYTKQWKSWHNPEDDVVIGREDYPIPAGWQEVYNLDHPIQRAFFHALYSTDPARPQPGARVRRGDVRQPSPEADAPEPSDAA